MRWIWNTGLLSSAMMSLQVEWDGRVAYPPMFAGTANRGLSLRAAAQQQRHQLAALIERDELVAAADVRVADEDLRHGAPPGDRHHLRSLRRIEIDADVLDLV